jgi:radical SAM/Cys-rich protein
MKSLFSSHNPLASPEVQFEALHALGLTPFSDKIKSAGIDAIQSDAIQILQVNLGKMCNQTCKHCHVDAGPDRKEIMSRETLEACLEVLRKSDINSVDLTGGAPEMNPHFRWFVEEVAALNKHIIVRCNLTIILANKKYHDLPEFFKQNRVEVVSSLPHFTAFRTDRQRGEGVFAKSISALKLLNEVGYGKEGSGLILNLVYNPTGAILPSDQKGLEAEFKLKLKSEFDIDFSALFSITNMPISRYLEYLIQSENLEGYMQKLVDAFNPAAVQNVMCRNTISVGWDGTLYDCDFNQMLELQVNSTKVNIRDFDEHALDHRTIRVDDHCYGCTAGAGSSCGGEIA